jgi:hypothetical protein
MAQWRYEAIESLNPNEICKAEAVELRFTFESGDGDLCSL